MTTQEGSSDDPKASDGRSVDALSRPCLLLLLLILFGQQSGLEVIGILT